MKEPIPLKDNRGVVRAWACPRCKRVSRSVSCGGPRGRIEEAKFSREAAEQCGICQGCGGEVDCHTFARLCQTCRAAEHARFETLMASRPPEPPLPIETFDQQLARVRALGEDDDLSDLDQRAAAAIVAELDRLRAEARGREEPQP